MRINQHRNIFMNSSFKLLVILSLVVFVSETVSAQSRDGLTRAQLSLADAYRDYWFTGVSVNQWQVEADQNGAVACTSMHRNSSNRNAL